MINSTIKTWRNFGVYQQSRFVALIIKIHLFLILAVLRLIHTCMDWLQCFHNNPRRISVELRAVDSFLTLIKFFIPLGTTWPLLHRSVFHSDSFYLWMFNRVQNYGLGSLVSIPHYANIDARKLYKTHFIVCCKQLLKERYNIDLDMSLMTTPCHNNSKSNNSNKSDYGRFYPHDVEYFWITGHDEQCYEHSQNEKLVVYVHGGGYSLGGPSHIGYVARLSRFLKMRALFVHYAKPPQADIPYQVDQILTVYLYLVVHCKRNPKNIIFMGDSAGGGLCTLVIQKLSLLRLHQLHPLGLVLYSPFVDLAMDTESWIECQWHDLIVHKGYVSRSGLIAAGNNEQNLRSPFFSAIYASQYKVDCHVAIFVSKHECLLDDAQTLMQKLQTNNAFEVKECRCQSHNYHMIGPERNTNTKKALNEARVELETSRHGKELVYHLASWMPHAYPIFASAFPEADGVMVEVLETVQRWSNSSQHMRKLNVVSSEFEH